MRERIGDILRLQGEVASAKPYQVKGVRTVILKGRLGSEEVDQVIIYWSDEERALIAEVPELAECAVDGATYQQALANPEVAIQGWIDTANGIGRPIPEPKGRSYFA